MFCHITSDISCKCNFLLWVGKETLVIHYFFAQTLKHRGGGIRNMQSVTVGSRTSCTLLN
jgi:hypothetical protein